VKPGNLVKRRNKWQVPVNIVKNIRFPHSVWNILDSRAIYRFTEAFQTVEWISQAVRWFVETRILYVIFEV